MNEKLIDAIAQMWSTHPDAATLSLHWATIEQQLDAEGDRKMLEAAKTIRNRAAEFMKQRASARTSSPPVEKRRAESLRT
jgi:hypothetical protein